MGANDYALALSQLVVGEASQLADLDVVQHPLVRCFRSGIDNPLPDRAGDVLVRAQLLLQAPWGAIGRQQGRRGGPQVNGGWTADVYWLRRGRRRQPEELPLDFARVAAYWSPRTDDATSQRRAR